MKNDKLFYDKNLCTINGHDNNNDNNNIAQKPHETNIHYQLQ